MTKSLSWNLAVQAGLTALFLLCVAAAHSAAQEAAPVDDQQQAFVSALDQGIAALKEEQYEEAITAFTEAINIDVAGLIADPYLGRADAFAALEDYQPAIQDYTAAIDRNPNLAAAYNGRGKVYIKFPQGVSQALGDFNKAVELERNNAEFLANQGRAMAQVGMPQQALRVLNRSIDMNPENPDAFTGRAQAWAGLQDFAAAFADIDQAIQLDPENHERYYAKAVLGMAAKDFNRAVTAFGQALEKYEPKHSFDPPYVDPYLGSALAYVELGKEAESPEEQTAAYEAAIGECDQALEQAQETQLQRGIALFNRGVALRMLERYGEAIEEFTDAIDFSPEADYVGEAYFRRGIVWHYLHEYGLAIGDFEEAIAVNFEDVRPYLWLGFAHAANENYIEAIRAYGQAIHQDARYAPAHINRGLAYMQLEEFDKAERNFNEAIRLEPTEPEHYYRRGVAQMAAANLAAAVVSFSTAVEFHPEYTEAQELLDQCRRALEGGEAAAPRTELLPDATMVAPAPASSELAPLGPSIEELP